MSEDRVGLLDGPPALEVAEHLSLLGDALRHELRVERLCELLKRSPAQAARSRRSAVPVSPLSGPCRFLCSLELAYRAERSSDEGKATQDRSTGGPATHRGRSKRSSDGPKSVQIRVRGSRDRPSPQPAGSVRKRQIRSGLHVVWTKSGPKLPTHHCDLDLQVGCRERVKPHCIVDSSTARLTLTTRAAGGSLTGMSSRVRSIGTHLRSPVASPVVTSEASGSGASTSPCVREAS